MELTGLPLSGRVIGFIVLSIVPSLVLAGVVLGVARGRRSLLGAVPGWLAAAALGPVVATFLGVRLVIATFEGISTGGGGIGSVAAGMWEATQPLLFGFYAAFAICALAFVAAVRASLNRNSEDEAPSRVASISSIGIVVLAFCAAAATATLFLRASALIVEVADPRAVQELSAAEISQRISSRLIATAGTSVVMTLMLTGAVVVSALIGRDRAPHPALGRVLIFVTLLAVIGCGFNIVALRSWAGRLQETALTGTFPR